MNTDDNGELPEGWATARLGDLLESSLNGFGKRKQDVGSPVVVLRLADISAQEVLLTEPREVNATDDEVAKYRLRSDDLLAIRVNGSADLVGRLIRFRGAEQPVLYCDHFIRLRTRAGIVAQFLRLYGDSPAFRWYVETNKVSSAGQNTISQATLDEALFPLPPVAEQRRIVAAVEAVLAKVSAARERLNRVPAILKRFRQAVLAAACSGRLTTDWREKNPSIETAHVALARVKEAAGTVRTRRAVPELVDVPSEVAELEKPDGWVVASVAELLRTGALLDVKDGNHGSNHPKVSDFTKDGLPFITAAQVNDFRIDYTTAYKVTGEPLKQLKVGFAQSGDAILTHKGSVGRAALNTQDCVLTPQTTYYRCQREALDASYLVYFFASLQFYNQLALVMSQTTRDFVPISEQYLLHLLIPPLAEQQEIVRQVDKLFALADMIEARLTDARQSADRLTQAVLAKAFRGELVPTEAELARRENRTYETATELLARVRAANAEAPAKPTRARKPKNADPA